MFRHSALARLITNFLLFQACWFLAFFYQQQALLLMLVGCFLLFLTLSNRIRQVYLLLLCLPLGIALEAVAIYLGLIIHPHQMLPLWLVLLWIALIFTFDSSLKALLTLPWKLGALILGGLAPLSYIFASNFGVFEIGVPLHQFYPAFGSLWLVCTLFIIIIYDWLFAKS
ncbi:DUF2878 domain-containing protein [Pseudoalteromonas byunsanensis]|uniref:DUF2878 domain-containing protein n=1 Tax=Pseudoalteromonas byunsanensis TaxID=327939 RepID=A0A1S1MZG7_9GAMM|nr:DUF2878 domain-containing protein [Pseudoalteromonas byunsanensis]OHU94333.1 hypothetical protein BIW53_14730 [Pseudoalteromonas byunsanensis]